MHKSLAQVMAMVSLFAISFSNTSVRQSVGFVFPSRFKCVSGISAFRNPYAICWHFKGEGIGLRLS